MQVQQVGAVAGLGHIFDQEQYPFPAEQVRARWASEIDDQAIDCFAVIAENELAGFAATRGAEFLHFGTAVHWWGSGLADTAYEEVEAHLRAQGHQVLWLQVFEENLRAIRLYQRHGWKPTEQATRSAYPPHPTLRRYELDVSTRP